jgi:hypothetical protein
MTDCDAGGKGSGVRRTLITDAGARSGSADGPWGDAARKARDHRRLEGVLSIGAPTLVADRTAGDPFLGETDNLRPQVVAHEIELMLAIALRGMTGELRGRRGKDQPSTTGIDGGKAKHVLEEGPIGFGVACVHDGMHACDHNHLHRCKNKCALGGRSWGRVPVVTHYEPTH